MVLGGDSSKIAMQSLGVIVELHRIALNNPDIILYPNMKTIDVYIDSLNTCFVFFSKTEMNRRALHFLAN